MNQLGFSNPLGLLALLALPVIVLFYLLKQRHKRKEVPSLWLWQKVLQQNAGYCWRQKLKWKTLLVLQLLAAAAIALALANPLVLGVGDAAHQVLVVDTSFSMSAKQDGATRLEAAKTDAASYVKNHRGSFTLVAWGSQADVLVQESNQKDVVLNALEGLEAGIDGNALPPLESLLTLYGEEGAQVVVFSDYPFSTAPQGATVMAYGKAEENIAVTGLARREQYLLAKVAGYQMQEERVLDVSLFGDGVILDTQQATLSPSSNSADVVFTLTEPLPQAVSVRVMVEDALPGDDTFSMALQSAQEKKVLLVGEGNWYLEKALGALTDVNLYRQGADQPVGEGYDLVIFDGNLPDTLPTEGQIWILNPPEGQTLFSVTGTLADQQSGTMLSPLNPYMEQLSFYVKEAKKVVLPAQGQTVLSGQDGPLIWLGSEGAQKICLFTFDLSQSTLPLQQEFPILVYQLMEYFFPGEAARSGAITGGEGVELALLASTKSAVVVSPDGTREELLPQQPLFLERNQSGIYTLEETHGDGSVTTVAFGVNPQTEMESNLTETAQLEGERMKGLSVGISLQQGLLLLVLALLLGEWWVMRRGD